MNKPDRAFVMELPGFRTLRRGVELLEREGGNGGREGGVKMAAEEEVLRLR